MNDKQKYKDRAASIERCNKDRGRDRDDVNPKFSRDNKCKEIFGRIRTGNRDWRFLN